MNTSQLLSYVEVKSFMAIKRDLYQTELIRTYPTEMKSLDKREGDPHCLHG